MPNDEDSSSDEHDDDFDDSDDQVGDEDTSKQDVFAEEDDDDSDNNENEVNNEDEEDHDSDNNENEVNNEYEEDEEELGRATDYSSSSSSIDSSGSEYAPIRSKFGSSKKNAYDDPSQPSSSGLVGTNGNLRYKEESDESDVLHTSPVHKKKNNKRPHKLTPPSKKSNQRKKAKDDTSVSPVSNNARSPLAPAQIVRGSSLASKRRTLRGKGRKEGMVFSAQVRQEFQNRKKRPTPRGRGSRGGKIAHQLTRERARTAAALNEDQEKGTQLQTQQPSRPRTAVQKSKEAPTRSPPLRRNPPRGQKSTNKKRGGKKNRGG